MKNDRYILRKYVMAKSASQAMSLDKKTPVHEVWVDEDYKKNQSNELASCIGFSMENEDGN